MWAVVSACVCVDLDDVAQAARTKGTSAAVDLIV
jgi:hypothetical protein